MKELVLFSNGVGKDVLFAKGIQPLASVIEVSQSDHESLPMSDKGPGLPNRLNSRFRIAAWVDGNDLPVEQTNWHNRCRIASERAIVPK